MKDVDAQIDQEKSNRTGENEAADTSRRSFLGKVGGATAAVLAVGIPLEPLFEGKYGEAEASVVHYGADARVADSYAYRADTAQAERINVGELPDNGDGDRFTDYSGLWSKSLKHDAVGIPNAQSYTSLLNALGSGKFQDFEHVIVGTPGGKGPNSLLNGPQCCLAFDLEGLDSHATNGIPPAPSVTSAQSAAEAVEHYWGALLRDVPFTDYASNQLAAQAIADMNKLSFLRSPQNKDFPFPVTAQNLFRGQFSAATVANGNIQGPYLSQFMLQPTFFGCQAMSQLMQRFASLSDGGANYMTAVDEYQNIQNGVPPSRHVVNDKVPRYMRMGRDLAAYTRVDVLHQAYFVAFLVLAGLGAPTNPGNPYIGSQTERPFGTLGGPDAAATIPEMATRALKAAWFHKWIVNLRMRPEEFGALVQANLTHQQPFPQAAGALHPDVLNSAALPLTYSQYGTYLLPQAFPEGAPAHPCYPTGHGTVAGACITALKFFFDGNQRIRPLLLAAGSDVMVPSEDGLSLVPYTGADRDSLTINGELVKLGFNVSFGHGIHAGIHFRSSTTQSLLLGQQVALSVLRDRARSYNEPFTMSITTFDGKKATISNQ
jgi:hypothetical protein